MSPARISRRRLLRYLTGGSVVCASALALGQIGRYFSFQGAPDTPALVPAGAPEMYAPGTVTYHAPSQVYIGRDEAGLYAVDAHCTHLGCLLEREETGAYACPCHGSRFSAAGAVENGPADEPLRRLALRLSDDGQVLVDRAHTAGAGERLPA